MDTKEQINNLTEVEAKDALSKLLDHVVKNTSCWRCPLTECDMCDVENKGRLRKYLLDIALKETQHEHKGTN